MDTDTQWIVIPTFTSPPVATYGPFTKDEAEDFANVYNCLTGTGWAVVPLFRLPSANLDAARKAVANGLRLN